MASKSMIGLDKPRHLWPDYASQFADGAVAVAYKHRPPYPEEAARIVTEVIGATSPCLLELGAGSGDFTLILAEHCAHVTAVEPAAAMRVIGERRTFPFRSVIDWSTCSAESFVATRIYDAAVAAESLHWMDWDAVLPTVRNCLAESGLLILVDRDLATPPPWESELARLIAAYSTNRHYQPFDIVRELESRNLFQLAGRCQTKTIEHQQSVANYVESIHSRNGFSRERMSTDEAAAFDRAVLQAVAPYAQHGVITLETMATISWGHITKR